MNEYNFENVNVENLESMSDYDMRFPEVGQPNEVSHDDGTMHVRYNGMRYCFGIGQDVSNTAYNRQANSILRDINVTGPRVTGSNN